MLALRCMVVGLVAVVLSGPPRAGAADPKAGPELLPSPGRVVFPLDRNDESSFQAVAFSPDEITFAAVTDRLDLRLWDLTRGHEIGVAAIELQVPLLHCRSLVFSPDGKRLAATFEGDGFDGSRFFVGVWDVSCQDRPAPFRLLFAAKGEEGLPTLLHHVSFSPDGRTVAACGPGRMVYLWEAATGQERLRIKGGVCAAFSPDGRKLLTVDFNGRVQQRDPAKGWPLDWRNPSKDANKDFIFVRVAAFAPDGQRVAVSDGYVVKIKDVAGGDCLGQFEAAEFVRDLRFTPDGQIVCMSGKSGVGFLDGQTAKLRSWCAASEWRPLAFGRSGQETVGLERGDVVGRTLSSLLACTDRPPRQEGTEPPGVQLVAELVTKKISYDLDLGGLTPEKFSERLLTGKLPPTPEFDLSIEVRNTGDQKITLGAANRDYWPVVRLAGPGAVNLSHSWDILPDILPNQSGWGGPLPVSLAPGQTYSIRVKNRPTSRLPLDRDHACYWLVPGEYVVLHVTLMVAVSPAPKGARVARDDFGYVILRAAPLKLKVREAKK